jgi:hypothetical protein
MWLPREATPAALKGRCGVVGARVRWLLALALPVALLLLPAGASSAPLGTVTTASACNLVASPTGSDTASGTIAAPFQTVQKLVNSLTPGETGCVETGTYDEDVRIAQGGVAGAPVTLAAYPGDSPTIVGRMEIVEGANYVTVTGLNLNGENPTQALSPIIDANNVTFSHDDVTNDDTGICFGIGSATWGWATGTLITHDRIHGCGQPNENYQHGLYIGAATDTTIEWSLIYGNAARGIQLYPDAQHTTIDHNVIDDNGEGILISGANGLASSYTNIYDNIITGATARHDVESYWPADNPVGIDNTVHDNCLWGGREGTLGTADGGYTYSHNLTANPQYINASDHDYELRATSPCLVMSGDPQAAVDGVAPVQPTAATVLATRRKLAVIATRRRRAPLPQHLRVFAGGDAAETSASQLR